MAKNSTIPNLKDTLQFCIFLVQEQQELYDNKTWQAESRQHEHNLEVLSDILKESESTMEMSEKQFKKCCQVFGEELAKRLFANVRIVKHDVPPTNAEALFKAIKAKKLVASRTKKAPSGFFNNEAKESFESALFKSRNGKGK